jgi:hypothetical protein
MPVSANHIMSQKMTTFVQVLANLAKQHLRFDKVMERVVGNDYLVGALRIPMIYVRNSEFHPLADSALIGQLPAALQHMWIHVETFKEEISTTGGRQFFGETDFGFTVPRADTKKVLRKLQDSPDALRQARDMYPR